MYIYIPCTKPAHSNKKITSNTLSSIMPIWECNHFIMLLVSRIAISDIFCIKCNSRYFHLCHSYSKRHPILFLYIQSYREVNKFFVNHNMHLNTNILLKTSKN